MLLKSARMKKGFKGFLTPLGIKLFGGNIFALEFWYPMPVVEKIGNYLASWEKVTFLWGWVYLSNPDCKIFLFATALGSGVEGNSVRSGFKFLHLVKEANGIR